MEIGLESALADAFESLLSDVHTALPGRVEAYDAAAQTADVKPLVIHPELGSLAVLPNVPVAWPRGGGGYLHMPLAVGDFVFILCAEASIDQWRAKGGAETPPGDPRRHSFTAAVALPCVYPSSRPISGVQADTVSLGAENGKSVHVTQTGVALGGAMPLDAISLASKVDLFIATLDAMFRTWVAVPMDGGAALKAAFLASFAAPPGSVASTVVKSE